jgi:hypothetical protein
MSLQFNDTTNYKGIVQIYEKECGFNRGDISGDTDKLKEFTADVNLAWDSFLNVAFKSDGTWQFDDSNQTDYPIIVRSIVSGQRDYPFTTDEQGNLILHIYKVMIADSSGIFREIYPVDQQTSNNNNSDTTTFIDGQNLTGIPTRYDKTANGIFLDPVPNYSRASSLKVFINREPSYFTYQDTTKKPGVPGLFHEYFALKPAESYARRFLSNDAYTKLANAVAKMERDIGEEFGRREKDKRRGMRANVENTR